ncbi:LOW QUALITY PROTEIN: putative sodium-coupled neutral amino acid transporter 10 [Ixodes scapularis]|uniref:LOW QUALITY PROTEIN: putative sodium-coupled neutral amino acid transporter 10 n=1 Tax=Ixodes scapularis TaxID=6945 RepID=UPI001A9F7E4C|nr:LOW QUALITY PROTEIN: putative sodium-coupled neutral amino acid transporter 10 [Ixodes scapularis]
MPSSSSLKNTINLGNSIIGVSILAMPYCFAKCGIVLSTLLLLISGVLTRLTCHLLLKAAVTARRRNYELLAFHTYGPTGKLVVEIGILGFLLGSCVAFFVVVGDLAPPLASDFFLVEASPRVRTTLLLLLGTCVGLPLGLLRNLDSLTSFSAMSLVFYALLVLKIFGEAFPVLWSMTWWDKVVLWRHENLLSVLPIFAMALSCQPQLFEIFDTLNEPSLMRMNRVVNGAVQMCSIVYIMMGFFGYVAFCGGGPIPGNILVRVGTSLASEAVKLGFVATLVVSFPLCLFPCRTSLHSLLFKRVDSNTGMAVRSTNDPELDSDASTVAEQGSKFHDPAYDYIPDSQFRALTVLLVGTTLATAVLVPDIEVVLGLTGSTIGTLICIIMPGMIFTRVIAKSTNEHLLGKALSWAGLFIMVGCTVTTLHNMSTASSGLPAKYLPPSPAAIVVSKPALVVPVASPDPPKVTPKVKKPPPPEVKPAPVVTAIVPKVPPEAQRRIEPPEPQEPQNNVAVKAVTPPVIKEPVVKEDRGLDPEALRKEDREIEDTKRKKTVVDAQPPKEPEAKKQEQLLEKIAEEQKAQKKILEDLQRELKQEIAKHKDSDSEKANKTAPKPDLADVQRPEVPLKQTEASAQGSNLQQHVQKDSLGPQAVLAPVQQNANQQPVRQERPVQQNAVREPVRQDVRPPVQPLVKQPPQQNAPRLIQQNVEQLKQQQALPAQQKDVRPVVEEIKPRGIDSARQPYNVFKPQEPVADKVILSNVNLPKNRGDIEEPVAKKVPLAGPAVEIPKVAEKLQQKLQKPSIPIQPLQAAQKSPQDGLPQAAVADDRPLAEKMSMDVKRDAPPISVPLIPAAAAVGEGAAKLQPKGQSEAADGAVAPQAVVDQRKADVVADLSKSAANPQIVPEGLPSQVHMEAALAKNEIRK